MGSSELASNSRVPKLSGSKYESLALVVANKSLNPTTGLAATGSATARSKPDMAPSLVLTGSPFVIGFVRLLERLEEDDPGALVVNIGDTLELVSGGHFRATGHRVAQPPPSQSTFERLSLVCFNGSRGDLRMQPCWESPLIKPEGCFESQGAYKELRALQDQGIPVPTNKEWREISIAKTRHPTDDPEFKQVDVNGVKMFEVVHMGVRVLQPV